MSNSDRKAIIALVILYHIVQKYSGIMAKEYSIYINNLIRIYTQENPVSENEMNQMKKALYVVDVKIAELGFTSTITLTLAMGYMIAEYFLQYVKQQPKIKAWKLMLEYCNRNPLIKHTARNKYTFSELDKADVISEIILTAA